MAYRPMKYQYETSPRKLKPEYEPIKNDDVKKLSSKFVKSTIQNYNCDIAQKLEISRFHDNLFSQHYLFFTDTQKVGLHRNL